jgi:hypothetical protein
MGQIHAFCNTMDTCSYDSLDALLAKHIAAAPLDASPSSQQDLVGGGYAAHVLGFAADAGASHVFLLSQARLGDARTAASEVTRLATFLGVRPGTYDLAALAVTTTAAVVSTASGSTMLNEVQAAAVDSAFSTPSVPESVVKLF